MNPKRIRISGCLFLAILMTSAMQCQTVLDIDFNQNLSGYACLWNTNKLRADTVPLNGSHLTYDSNLKEPTLFYFWINGYNNRRPMEMVLSNKTTEVVFDEFKISKESQIIWEIYPNKPEFVKDPNNNEVFYQFHKEWMTFYDTIIKLSSNDSEVLFEKRKAIHKAFVKSCDTLITQNNDQFVSAVIIDYLVRNQLIQQETVQQFYNRLSSSVKSSYYGIMIGENVGNAKRIKPGKAVPDFELIDLQNQKYDLKNLRGKKVLLHFWASHCAPCLEEGPDLVSLQNSYQENLIVINVSLDQDKDNWHKGVAKAGMEDLVNVRGNDGFQSQIAKDYVVKLIPVSYLIDENGKLILKGTLEQISNVIENS